MRGLVLLLAVSAAATGVHAAVPSASAASLCPQAGAAIVKDPWLERATKAAYSGATELSPGSAVDCVFPYVAIVYENSLVLITLGATPGEGCHGCGARLSAVFFRREADRLRELARHRDFGQSGSWGALRALRPVRFGAEEGIVVEGGGLFQGELSYELRSFIFRDGRAIPLSAEGPIISSFNACGNAEPCDRLESVWRVDPGGRLVLNYETTRADDSQHHTITIFERRGSSLVRVSGEMPEVSR
jgi:hypothetical protein